MRVIDGNKGMIAKGVLVDKFLKLLEKMPGGTSTRSIL